LDAFNLVDNWYQRKGARWLGRTVGSKEGLCTQIIAKISGSTFRLFLRQFFGNGVLTYTVNQ
jgi:hypothetical protein